MAQTLLITDWVYPNCTDLLEFRTKPDIILTVFPSIERSVRDGDKVPLYSIDDFIDEKVAHDIDATANHVVATWSLGLPADGIRYRGLNLCDYLAIDLAESCRRTLRVLYALRCLQEMHGITYVLATKLDSFDVSTLNRICDVLNLTVDVSGSNSEKSFKLISGTLATARKYASQYLWRGLSEARRMRDRLFFPKKRTPLLWENHRALFTPLPKLLLERGYELNFAGPEYVQLYRAVKQGLWGCFLEVPRSNSKDLEPILSNMDWGYSFRGVIIDSLIKHLIGNLIYTYFPGWKALIDVLPTVGDMQAVFLAGDHHLKYSLLAEYGIANNIPVIVLQHGFFGTTTYGALPKYANRMFVWGEIPKAWIEQQGISSERLVITGYPFERRKPSGHSSLRKPYTLLLALTWVEFDTARRSYRQNYMLVKSVLEALERLPDWELIVKLHTSPRMEPQAYFESLVPQRLISRVRITKGGSLDKFIEESTAVIVDTSTVGLEAMLRGKPLVVMDAWGLAEENAYIRWEATEVCRSGDTLAALLDNLVSDPSKWRNYIDRQEVFVNRYISYTGIEASKRIETELGNLIAKGVSRARQQI